MLIPFLQAGSDLITMDFIDVLRNHSVNEDILEVLKGTIY